ncbi:MAG: glycosyltransferase [Actinomycetota bacterium]
MSQRSIALCHEWITTYGGSEQVAQRLAETLDIDDVYTFAARPELARELFPNRKVHAYTLGKTGREHWQRLLPIMPHAWSRLDLSAYEVVITSSHSCSNAIRVAPGTVHISYCYTPMRYAWNWRSEVGRLPFALRPAWPPMAAILRRADRAWAQRVTAFVAISKHVASRILTFYGRDAEVVYPPVDTSYWTPEGNERGDYFLCAGRLVAYKRIDTAVRAAEMTGQRLVVAGDGPELRRLQRMAGDRTEFVVNPSNEELRNLYRQARALVFPGLEDFGLTMIEAQACGTPVIAFGEGGAAEAVGDGETGTLYREPTEVALAEAMRGFDPDRFDPAAIRRHAERFGVPRFEKEIRAVVDDAVN